MELQTVPQTYLLPATSQALNKALATLAALGLTYEAPREATIIGVALYALLVQMPVIPVVHHLDLAELRQELLQGIQKRAERPSHLTARSMGYGALETAYPSEFFSGTSQMTLAYSIAELVTREHIIQHFAKQGIDVRKITLSKPANEVLASSRFFQREGWDAFAEEARPVIPELATLLGAV